MNPIIAIPALFVAVILMVAGIALNLLAMTAIFLVIYAVVQMGLLMISLPIQWLLRRHNQRPLADQVGQSVNLADLTANYVVVMVVAMIVATLANRFYPGPWLSMVVVAGIVFLLAVPLVRLYRLHGQQPKLSLVL